jgi:hypothetical protein
LTLDKEFGAYLTIGRGAVFEVPFSKDDPKDYPNKVMTLIRAVVIDGFEEVVVERNGHIIGATGVIRQGAILDTSLRETWRKGGWNPFRRYDRKSYRYPPYSNPGTKREQI